VYPVCANKQNPRIAEAITVAFPLSTLILLLPMILGAFRVLLRVSWLWRRQDQHLYLAGDLAHKIGTHELQL
jgi:hypothetical protein